MIKSIFSLGLGTALTKVVPLIFSYMIASKLGNEEYTAFISFLLLANVIINFSVLGVVPQVISRNSRSICLSYILIPFSIAIIIWYFKTLSLVQEKWHPIYLLLYVIALIVIYLMTAFYNSILENEKAAWIWIVSGILGLISFAITFITNSAYLTIIVIFISPYIIVASFYMFNWHKEKWSVEKLTFSNFKKTLVNSIFISSFGFSVVFSFYHIQTSIDGVEKLIFSVFYQFFTIATFLPSVMGNIIVPRLSRGVIKDNHNIIIPLIYFLIFVFLTVFSVFSLLHWSEFGGHLNMQRILINSTYNSEITLLLLTTCVAVFNTYKFQVAISQRQFKFLFCCSLAWLALFLLLTTILGATLLAFSVALFVCYLSFALALNVFMRIKNGKTNLAS
ncbi:conserved membrane hypothetical protein [Vibrio chagasii]|nr:conserved membrane hypothetical protein [Vibrio chagasii]CAH6982475.1 conserved membrane hypothetical protein [Vibrio chagasii]CAH7041986.1 conserved membrane hypothetical protein [Vibrio chagasii]